MNLKLFDTTLRDRAQAEGISFVKLDVGRFCSGTLPMTIGCHYIEALPTKGRASNLTVWPPPSARREVVMPYASREWLPCWYAIASSGTRGPIGSV